MYRGEGPMHLALQKEYIYDEQTEAENGPKDITLYCPVVCYERSCE